MDFNDEKTDVIKDENNCFNNCPISTTNDNIIRFYYLDAFEDFTKHPG